MSVYSAFLPGFYTVYQRFSNLFVSRTFVTHQTRQRFSNLLVCNVGEPVWIAASAKFFGDEHLFILHWNCKKLAYANEILFCLHLLYYEWQ